MTNPKPINKASKHHYIPEGYLKGWIVAPEEKIVEYRMLNERLIRRWTHPGGTGYQMDLYTMASLGRESDTIEKKLLALVDSKAAEALRSARNGLSAAFSSEDKIVLSSFVTSLLARSPESINSLKAGVSRWWRAERPEMQEIYSTLVWRPGMPTSVDDALALLDGSEDESRFFASVLPGLLAHKNIKDFLCTMYWRVIYMPKLAPSLLTSDQPLIMTNGLSHADGHLAVPISPRAILMAARTGVRMNKILTRTNLIQVAKRSNLLVVQRARKFVYAHDEASRAFVEEHFGKSPILTVGQKVGEGDPWNATSPKSYTPGKALRDYSTWRLTVED